MSIIIEFVLPTDAFMLGDALGRGAETHIELERIVPLGQTPIPYVWVTGIDPPTVEQTATVVSTIESVTLLDQIGDRGLYRIDWQPSQEGLLRGLLETGGTILEAEGDDTWFFRVRFQDHQSATAFYKFCETRSIPIQIERVVSLTAHTVARVELTQEQKEALILAARRGYFETPREVSLALLGDELGISAQAVSKRLRPAIQKLVHHEVRSLEDGRG